MLKRAPRSMTRLCTIAGLVPALWTGIFSPVAAQTVSSSDRDIKHLDHLLSRAVPQEDCVHVGDMRFKASALRVYRDRLAASTTGRIGTRASVHPWAQIWPGGVVPYAYSSSVSATRRAEFEAALREWQLAAKLKFVPRTTEADYILVVAGNDGNWSWVGKIGGVQELHIQQWADTGIGSQAKFLICHEIAHALGLIHEQSRADRNNYVTIRTDNIDTASYGPNVMNNFDVVPGSLNQGTYDFESIMHYRKDTFAKPGTISIQALPAYSPHQNMMGQLTHLSTLDKSGMARLYGLPRRVSGFARTDTGAAIRGVNIRISGSSPYRAANPVPTNLRGAYAFAGLPSDTYTIRAAKAGYALIPAAQTVKITLVNAVNVDFLALQGVRISGRIVKGGVGMAGVVVTRRNILTGAQVSVTTNQRGYYGFSNVPTGTGVAYSIIPSKAGHVFTTTRVMPLNESTPTNYDNVNFKATLSTLSTTSTGIAAGDAIAAPSSVTLSIASAESSTDSVRLNFAGALDAATAGAVEYYAVLVNGRIVPVANASYHAGTSGVTLQLVAGTLRSGDRVTVYWKDLQDAQGRLLSGQIGPLTAS